MTLTRNQRYEQSKRESGLTKITIWVPEHTAPDFKIMSEFCINNPDHTPFMCRNIQTGRMAKAV